MKKAFAIAIAILIGLSLAFTVCAQDKPAKSPKVDRIQGVVQSINKETSTLNVKDHKTGIIRQVTLTADTKFTKVNKPGAKLDEVKEGTRIIALGKFDEKQRLAAERIDIRLPK